MIGGLIQSRTTQPHGGPATCRELRVIAVRRFSVVQVHVPVGG